jgi:hypothetical protein
MPVPGSGLRSRLPKSVRDALGPVARPYYVATRGLRVAPSFLVIGAAKAGTTSLWHHVFAHPATLRPSSKEVNYFNNLWHLTPAWYRGQFPSIARGAYSRVRSGVPPVCGEATPTYMYSPDVPERVRSLLPDARLVAVLRDPVDRAISDYHHCVAMGWERAPLEAALEDEAERLGQDPGRLDDPAYARRPTRTGARHYLARSIYDRHLRRWLDHFAPDQLLVIESECLFADPSQVMPQVYDHLGLPPFELRGQPVHNRGVYAPADPALRDWLGDFFSLPNQRLVDLLGVEFSWAAKAREQARSPM